VPEVATNRTMHWILMLLGFLLLLGLAPVPVCCL
jgi:hypothetical protein